MNDNLVAAVFLICLTILIILFVGDPDIHDALIEVIASE